MKSRTKRGRKKRKATPGSFKPGPDSRRHVFTPSDCRVGYLVAAIKHPELREWLKMKIRVYYHRRSKHDSTAQERSGIQRAGDCHAGPAAGYPAGDPAGTVSLAGSTADIPF